MEAMQAISFSEEENTNEPRLSGQILNSKHKAKILYQAGAKKHWIFSGFVKKKVFFVLIITPQFVY